MREIRVVTPDGYVWFVRLRWAWRWVPWTPLLTAAAARRERARQARKRRGTPDDYPLGADADTESLGEALEASIVGILVVSVGVPLLFVTALVLIVAPIVWFPAWGHWLAHHLGEVAATVGVLLATVAVALAGRPWLVEAEPMALNKPGRAWRVRGWRRAERCAREVAASIEEGRFDVEPRDAVPVEHTRSPA